MVPWVSHQHAQMSTHARDNLLDTPSHEANNNQHGTQQCNMQPTLPHSPNPPQLQKQCARHLNTPILIVYMLFFNMPESDSCAKPSLHGICTVKLITSWSYCHAKYSRRATQAAPNDMPCLAHFARSAHAVVAIALWTARPGHTTLPRLFRHQPHLFRQSWCQAGPSAELH